MADKHLKAARHKVNNEFCWYEEKRGICICTQAFNNGRGKYVILNYIPWNSIRAALKRKDKA